MPSALEKLIKILNLEKRNGYNNKAVIGGLQAYAPNWAAEARQEAQRPEQMALVEEILRVMADYNAETNAVKRGRLAKYMIDRMTQRVEPLPEYKVEPSPEVQAPPREKPAPQPKNAVVQERRTAHFKGAPPPKVAEKPRRKKRPKISLEEAHQLQAQLAQPLTAIAGIGEKMADKLEKIGPRTVGELLYLFPRRYDDYTRMLPLAKLTPYGNFTVIGTIRRIREQITRSQRNLLVVTIEDGTASMDISFFNQIWLKRQLKPGMQLVFSGKTEMFLGKITMTNPAWEPIDQESLHTGGIVPIYPLTKGISARTMRRMMKNTISYWAGKVVDYMPESVLDRTDQVDLEWALRQVHFPEKWEYIDYARQRLAFDELLLIQLGVMGNRAELRSQPAPALPLTEDWLAQFEASLPFQLTNAQRRAIEEIRSDLAQEVPMSRLLQGDVGSGKTIVAAVALAAAALNQQQAALMAPTSILAEQHYRNISKLFSQTPQLENMRVALLTGSLTDSERAEVYAGLADGSINVVVGTHAVIQAGVNFKNLAVAVVDEQHRFGVGQRGSLRGKGTNPHLLVMTATPIPRTLALTVYADLDLSILDEMPPGRTPIQTRLLTPALRTRAYMFVEENVLKRGQQAYVIYPLVEASERLEAESAVEGYEFIQKQIYPKYRVGLIHGRMRADEKESVMAAFSKGEIDVLVSTSVIEVGVDVPNATAILIENAERFGLAQLHQFRGRVGRGDKKSYCLLITEESSPRLQALEETTDGFKLAELDWRERGAGDLLGVRQSGEGGGVRLPEQMDIRLVELAQQECRALLAEDPDLSKPEHALLVERVMQLRHEQTDLS